MTDADAGETSSVKTPLKGLVDMGRTAFDNSPTAGITDNPTEIAPYAASFGGIVINLTWGQLQPTAGSPLGTNNLIDQELAPDADPGRLAHGLSDGRARAPRLVRRALANAQTLCPLPR